MLVTWLEIVPTDSADKIGATASAVLLELLAAPLVSSNPQIPSSTTSCRNSELVAPLLEAQLLLASKPVDMATSVEPQSPGNVHPREDLHLGPLVVPVVASVMLGAQEDPHLGPLVVLVEAAQTTAMLEATVVATLRAAQLHGSNNNKAMLHLNKLDTVATVVTVMAERPATTRVTDRQQHLAWHHGNNKLMVRQEARHHPLQLIFHHPLPLRTNHLPHQALERDWRRRETGTATICR